MSDTGFGIRNGVRVWTNDVILDTTNFAGILSSSNTTVQSALDTLDDHLHSGQTLTCDGITPNGSALAIALGDSAGNDFTIDTTSFVVEGDTGSVIIGATAPIGFSSGYVLKSQVSATDTTGGFGLVTWNTSQYTSPVFSIARSNAATVGTYTALSDGWYLGALHWLGADGVDFQTIGAAITVEASDDWSENNGPTDMSFAINSGAASPTEILRLTSSLTVGVEVSDPAGKFHIDQASTTGAMPVLVLDQGDVSEEFIRLIGQSTTDNSQSLVDAADLGTPGSIVGWFKIYVQDDQGTNPITDGIYYCPFYSTPT